MTKFRGLCIERRILGALLLTMGLMAGSAMGQACGDADAGDCCGDTGSPACSDLACCEAVCADDPFCCDVLWDGVCADAAVVFCPGFCLGGCECPDGAIDEPEDCGTDSNGGCNSVPTVFGEINCGETFCGTAWADGGTRDTDWYLLTIGDNGTGVADLTASLSSDFPGVVFIVGGIDTCAPAILGTVGSSNACGSSVDAVATVNAPGNYVIFVATGNPDGSAIFDGIPCGGGNNGYTVALATCDQGGQPAPPCPADLNGDGTVGTSDLLELFANWGLCPK